MDMHEDDVVEETAVDEDLEAPEADAAEQHQPVAPDEGHRPVEQRPFDVDEYDAAEQRREVQLDEDDYR
jgi:hypothetical protein